jgi:serine/threonine protein kinase/Flp pilus assembly protein TadD
MATGGTDRNPVEVLSEEFLERIRRGEAVTPEEYALAHPELADEILALFPALLMMEDLGEQTSDRTASIAGEAGMPVGGAAGRLGEFRLLREVGRGGMGVVYEAEQESLGRRVALKVLPTGALNDPKQVRRFEREARAAARLHHTNIVPVFGVGQHEGTHYYVMQFIEGQGLDAVLSELKRLRAAGPAKSIPPIPNEPVKGAGPAADIARSLVTGRFVAQAADASPTVTAATAAHESLTTPALADLASQSGVSASGASGTSRVTTLTETDRRFAEGVARIGVQVAEALAHAHGQGVLHRDIKPSNLLLDRDGNVWVTDFGLAKAAGGEDLTHTGDVIGTVRYMAPERFEGAGDARADLYALGLTLYEMLALRPAFNETDRASLVRQVTQEEPPRLRGLNRQVPLDLETIVHKAIARDPAHRYESANAMSDDLQRFLDGRPILARRVSSFERLYRWARRNPALAASLGCVALLLLVTTIGSVIAAAWFRNTADAARIAARAAEAARQQADQSRRQAERASSEAEARRVEAEGQRRRAESSLAESQASLALARKAVDDSFTKVSESTLMDVPGLRPLRRDLLESARAFYEEFLRRGGDEPGLLADLAATQARVGLIHTDLSEQDKARVALRRAAELYDKALVVRPNDIALLERLSEVWHRLGDLDHFSDRPASNASYQKAVTIRARLAAEHPAEPRFRMALSRSLNGIAITTNGDTQLDAYKRSLELRLQLAGEIPEDPDLLHGLSESFLNIGSRLWASGDPEQALELTRRSIDYGRAGLARRPHDFEFALDLASSYQRAAYACRQLVRHDEALAISDEAIVYLRKLTADNPEVPAYRSVLASVLDERAACLGAMNRREQAISTLREVAEMLEKKPDPDASTLATASFYRGRSAVLLAGDAVAKPFESWPEAARREADVAVADLKNAVDRGFRQPDLIRRSTVPKSLLARADVKALLAEMDRSPKKLAPATAAPKAPPPRPASPLDQPGRLEEDRILGALSVGLLQTEQGEPEQISARLHSMLASIDAQQKSGIAAPALKPSAEAIRVRLGVQLWKIGRLAEAKHIWDELFSPPGPPAADLQGGPSALTRFAPAMEQIADLLAERGLWEQAALYDGYHRAGNAEGRIFRSYQSGVLALARGGVAVFRELAAEGLERLPRTEDLWVMNAVRTATLSPVGTNAPEPLVELAQGLVARNRDDAWRRVVLGHALSRAGRDTEALAALREDDHEPNGKAVVALIHARAGRSEQARRWLHALERDLEQYIRDGHLLFGALTPPHYWPFDILRADVLRREAYALLHETAPELRALRLLRADAFWRLDEPEKAEPELNSAVAGAPDVVAALVDRARAFETLGARDRADTDLAEAARRDPQDPRPWVARGKLLAERGLGFQADAAYMRAAELAPGRFDPFVELGYWVAGPYPEEMNRPWPPEANPDPARPVASETGSFRPWKPACVNEDRFLYLGAFAGRPRTSVYTLAHVASTRDRTALLCLGGGERLRLWLNGRVVFDTARPHTYRNGAEYLVPVTLRAGRNTLLARVSHDATGHGLRLRFADFELDRAYLLAEFGQWSQAADLFDRADRRGEFLNPWAKARQTELLAALGEKDRFLRAASRLADWDGPVRADPSSVAEGLGIMPNELTGSERLVAIAQQGVDAKPAEAWQTLPLGLAYYRAGRYRDALELLAKHLPAADGHAAPIRAMAHWRLNEKDQARGLLARSDRGFEAWCREREGGRGTAWLNWWFDGPQMAALRREAHELIDGRAPDDTATLAKVQARMGNLIDDTESPTWAYDLALRLEPGNAGHQSALAARLLELGRLADAEPLLAAMGEDKKDPPQSLVDRGSLLAAAGYADRAAADFARALERMPEDFGIWGRRAELAARMTEHAAAYDRLLELRPSDALLWYARAEQQLIRRDYKAAVADFTQLDEPPATSEFGYIYAAALLLAGDETSYRDYVIRQAGRRGDSREPFTLYCLARLAALAAHPAAPADRIVAWARRAVEAEPKVAWFVHAQALAFLRAGDQQAARKSLDLSRTLGWTNPGPALNDLVEAMVENRQPRGAGARAQLARVKSVFDRPVAADYREGLPLTDWLEFELLRRQIEGPLLDAAFPAEPFGR